MTDNENTSQPADVSAMERFRHAFAIGDQHDDTLEEDEIALLKDIARTVHKRGLTIMAVMMLTLHKPLNTLGANLVQMGQFLFETGPVTSYLQQFMGPFYSHELLVRTMEKRCSIDKLIELLEAESDQR